MQADRHDTLVAIARARAARTGDTIAYTNLRDGLDEHMPTTWGALDGSCRRIGAALQARGAAGERVLLLLPQGVAFVVGFLGTLYGGAVAVPAHTPKPSKRSWATFEAIVADCRPLLVLTCRPIRDKMRAWSQREESVPLPQMLCIEDIEAEVRPEDWDEAMPGAADIAFLQYTSGSTSTPKGVMVSHANLVHNAALTARHMGHDERTVIVSWLPLFHDLGLIGIVVQTLFVGATCFMMSPAAFAGNPALWLQAIGRYRATTSMSSDFGYRLCIKAIRPEQMEGVDLSCWRNALNAAEPIHASTLRGFQERFAPYGFAPDAFFPAYGLAEATLLSTTSRVGEAPVFLRVDKAALARGALVPASAADETSVELVSSGRPADDMDVAIVDPQTGRALPEGEMGEVWVRGASIARGYWLAPQASRETFGRSPAGANAPGYLRTGDLGFLHARELFIVGRLKDLIIARGRNIYPQDIELTVKDCHAAFRTVNGAAFSVEGDEGETTVVVHEIERSARHGVDLEALARIVRDAVWREHDIRLADVVLIPPASLPKTTSGKVQRRMTKSLYLAGELSPLRPREAAPGKATSAPSAEVMEARILAHLRTLAGEAAARGRPDDPFGALGLDSVVAAQLAQALATELDCPLEPTIFWHHPTPARLARYLATGEEGPAADAPTPAPALARSGDERTRGGIAIVGVSCRLPGAASKEAFWAHQEAGRDAIRPVPRRRWDAQAIHGDPHRDPGRTDVGVGGFIDGEDLFAPEVFGISAYEAELMDPQHRLFLKAAYEAIWDAGHDPAALAGRAVGVFAGVQFQDYQALLAARGIRSAQACTGNAHAMLANRVSYLLDVHGPSEAIDTACSGSLVAIHRAVRALRDGECDLAIAGGVNLLLTPDLFVMGRQMGVLSPTGRCRTFDADADGYVRAEGVGALLLRPLEEAIRDRDHVWGVIEGSAVNHGGRAASLTAPSSAAQTALMIRALDDAGLGPDAVGYVEMHGTGTVLGDPIEVESVGRAFRRLRARESLAPTPCALGSVKAAIGHLEPAAGVAGVINVLMAMRHDRLPGLASFRRQNPHIALEEGLFLQTRAGPWPAAAGGGSARAAMVNSFGFGGANACVVIRRPEAAARERAPEGRVDVPVAAATPALLAAHAAGLADAVETLGADGSATLADVAFTLRSRNEARPERRVLHATSLADLARALRRLAEAPTGTDDPAIAGPEIVARDGLGADARRWLRGEPATWADIAGARRCPLPVSPWPDRSLWFEPREPDAPAAGAEEGIGLETLMLEPVWREAPLVPGRALDGTRMLVIGPDADGVAAFLPALREVLPESAGVETILRRRGAGAEPSLDVARITRTPPDLVVVLPGETAGEGHAKGDGDGEVALLFDLARGLVDHAFGRPVTVFHALSGAPGAVPAHDALPAFAKSAFLEHDWLRIHTIHLGAGADRARALAAEVTAAPAPTPEAIRVDGGTRMRAALARVPARAARPAETAWFREGGVYLVPGGAGELGYRLLGRLVEEVEATFVLCGRSPIEGVVADRIDALARRAGGRERVRYAACDVGDLDATRALVDAIVARHGRLDGVVNLVTAHDDAYLYKKSRESFARVSGAKVRGTRNLDRATAALPLDLFVSFSSLAALGLAGGADYAYGCAFQSAFAGWRAAAVARGERRGASRTIAWSRWRWDRWVTVEFDDWFASLGFAFLDVEAGLPAWRDAMGRGAPETIVVHGRPDRMFRSLDLEAGLLRAAESPAQADAGAAPAPRTATSADGLADGLADHLRAIVVELLKLDDLDPATPFSVVGLDSVLAIRLVMVIEQRLGMRIPPKVLLDHDTAATLAAHLRGAQAATAGPAPAPAPPQISQDAIGAHLTARLAEILHADDVAPDASFVAIGVDSIIAVKLASDLDRHFGVGIAPRWFLDHPTVADLAREIARRTGAGS
ncbi:SDR family oxidoreductase [Salinarimonas chemoclinalis]|uniref:SDR family oxidoreductase n=1 Tax=Salinarimonas chemoclinalis TaxID=3241599 RepID=UPI0035586F79